jgi:tRNA(fMet)-specific endonuclease VapC
MGQKICIDTNILIDYLCGESKAVTWFNSLDQTSELCTTTINVYELYIGGYIENSVDLIEALLSRLTIIELNSNYAKYAAKIQAYLIKTGQKIDFRDCLIAGMSMATGCVFKTNDRKHFTRIPNLQLID